ncbi:hypothetical protein [Kibdelosporangium aridum]|uniref:Secreted protein n=1 Tax=Kibdelosporangium aridum TaxID=2030 RepID=A0A1W2FFT4_KIBAR|nr:hypothetical protein [Kibdelosporangium aridum]SMD20532.1 hypothetical protein SAMN05661093_06470 [Kibdelosporangium aridum]
MTNSIVRRSLAAAGVAIFMSGLLPGAASAAEALPQLQCEGLVDPPELEDDGAVHAEAGANCSRRVDVVGVRVWLQKYDDEEWKEVAKGSGRKENVDGGEAHTKVRCKSGQYRTVATFYARHDKYTYQNRGVSWPVRIHCR